MEYTLNKVWKILHERLEPGERFDSDNQGRSYRRNLKTILACFDIEYQEFEKLMKVSEKEIKGNLKPVEEYQFNEEEKNFLIKVMYNWKTNKLFQNTLKENPKKVELSEMVFNLEEFLIVNDLIIDTLEGFEKLFVTHGHLLEGMVFSKAYAKYQYNWRLGIQLTGKSISGIYNRFSTGALEINPVNLSLSLREKWKYYAEEMIDEVLGDVFSIKEELEQDYISLTSILEEGTDSNKRWFSELEKDMLSAMKQSDRVVALLDNLKSYLYSDLDMEYMLSLFVVIGKKNLKDMNSYELMMFEECLGIHPIRLRLGLNLEIESCGDKNKRVNEILQDIMALYTLLTEIAEECGVYDIELSKSEKEEIEGRISMYKGSLVKFVRLRKMQDVRYSNFLNKMKADVPKEVRDKYLKKLKESDRIKY